MCDQVVLSPLIDRYWGFIGIGVDIRGEAPARRSPESCCGERPGYLTSSCRTLWPWAGCSSLLRSEGFRGWTTCNPDCPGSRRPVRPLSGAADSCLTCRVTDPDRWCRRCGLRWRPARGRNPPSGARAVRLAPDDVGRHPLQPPVLGLRARVTAGHQQGRRAAGQAQARRAALGAFGDHLPAPHGRPRRVGAWRPPPPKSSPRQSR